MKHRWFSCTCAVVAMALAASCATTTRYNPFKVPQAEIQSKVKVIAIGSMNVPDDLDNSEVVKGKFVSLVSAKLQEGGFTVVSTGDYEGIWKQMTEKLGGFFDPMTGKRDDKKVKAVRDLALRELQLRTKADAVLDIAIVVVKAGFGANRAAWHGTSESLLTGGALAAFFADSYSGTVPALSCSTFLSDFNDVDMYSNSGGIQVLSKLSRGQFVRVPQNEILADEERNRRAVAIALNPLIGKSTEPDAPKQEKSSSF